MAGPYPSTPGNAVPPLDEDLEAALDKIRYIHPGLDQIADGLRLLALDRHDQDDTRTIAVALAGSPDEEDVLSSVSLVLTRLTNPSTNPALRTLPFDQQKACQQAGEQLAFHLADPDLHQHAANASAAIHTD